MDIEVTLAPVEDPGGEGGRKSASNKKTKKAKKGQKLDPFMLGFSVHAAERPNIGEIQSVNEVRK